MKHKKASAAGATNLAGAVLVALAAAAISAPAASETTVEPFIGLDLMWLDNLNLAESSEDKQEEYIGQVSPGLRLNQMSQRMTTYFDYRMQALFYEDDSDLNDVLHTANLSSDITAIEDWFFVGIDGSYFQSLLDPERPQNANNIFNVGNISDTAAGRITPQLRHRFGGVLLDASYSVGIVDYRESSDAQQGELLDDSRNDDAIAQLSTADQEATVTWLARYEYQHADYDLSLPFKYERALGEIGVRVLPTVRLIGRGGVESDPFEALGEGGLEESFWAAGFHLQRGERFELRVLGGERFFGTSWEALLRAKGRVLEAELNYEETPTTQAQRVAMRDVQSPDPALPIGPLTPEEALFGRATSEVYLLKRAHAALTVVGRLTRIGLDATAEKREYVLIAGLEDEFRSGRFFVNRRFGARTVAEFSASIIDADLREGGSYRDQLYDASVSREIGSRTVVSLTGHHLERSGDFDEYDANWVSVGLLMTF
jgi:uncharacterized protein (PEP-CTERM system associated)